MSVNLSSLQALSVEIGLKRQKISGVRNIKTMLQTLSNIIWAAYQDYDRQKRFSYDFQMDECRPFLYFGGFVVLVSTC